MRAINGSVHMSLEEIAQVEGITKSAVNMCLRRAMEKLRAHGLTPKMQDLAIELDRGRKGSAE